MLEFAEDDRSGVSRSRLHPKQLRRLRQHRQLLTHIAVCAGIPCSQVEAFLCDVLALEDVMQRSQPTRVSRATLAVAFAVALRNHCVAVSTQFLERAFKVRPITLRVGLQRVGIAPAHVAPLVYIAGHCLTKALVLTLGGDVSRWPPCDGCGAGAPTSALCASPDDVLEWSSQSCFSEGDEAEGGAEIATRSLTLDAGLLEFPTPLVGGGGVGVVLCCWAVALLLAVAQRGKGVAFAPPPARAEGHIAHQRNRSASWWRTIARLMLRLMLLSPARLQCIVSIVLHQRGVVGIGSHAAGPQKRGRGEGGECETSVAGSYMHQQTSLLRTTPPQAVSAQREGSSGPGSSDDSWGFESLLEDEGEGHLGPSSRRAGDVEAPLQVKPEEGGVTSQLLRIQSEGEGGRVLGTTPVGVVCGTVRTLPRQRGRLVGLVRSCVVGGLWVWGSPKAKLTLMPMMRALGLRCSTIRPSCVFACVRSDACSPGTASHFGKRCGCGPRCVAAFDIEALLATVWTSARVKLWQALVPRLKNELLGLPSSPGSFVALIQQSCRCVGEMAASFVRCATNAPAVEPQWLRSAAHIALRGCTQVSAAGDGKSAPMGGEGGEGGAAPSEDGTDEEWADV